MKASRMSYRLFFTMMFIWGAMYLTSITSEAATYSGGSGSSSDPYLISSEADLNALADFVNNGGSTTGMYFEQTGNITIVSDHKAIGQFEYYDADEVNTYFDGIYEGDNYTITASGTLASSDTAYTQGVFGCVGSNGVVKNLSVSADIDGDGLVGGIVGYNLGYIENCHFSGSISGDYVWHYIWTDNGDGTASSTKEKTTAFGGIVGRNYGSIIDCTNSGTISGGYNENGTGGIVGYSHGGTIEGCSNSGKISGIRIGGIAGNVSAEINSSLSLSTTITDCENTGDVLGGNRAGGIVGYNLLGTISDCENTGTISTNSSGSYGVAGGIVGFNKNTTISNCYNAGAVSSSTYGIAGGIAGQLLYSNVSQCINSGAVEGSGSYYIGGVAGWMHGGTISESYNSGAISGVAFSFGGVLGATNSYNPIEGQTYDDTNNNTIEYCYNTGDITVTQTSSGDSFNAGGIVGSIYDPVSNEVNCCYNIGDISGTTVNPSVPFCAGGIVGKTYDNNSTYSVIRIVYCYYDNSRLVSTDGVENTSVSAIGSIVGTTGSVTQVSTTGLSSAQMTYTPTTYMTGFSSSNKWTFYSGYYPVLAYDSPYDVEDELIGPNTYTITFDANGGSGSMSSMTAYDGVTLVLPDSTFESPSEDLVFSGWGRTADSLYGSMSLLFYGDTTVYAIWGNGDLTGIATITGTPYIGNTLTANVTESNHTGEFTYRWFYKDGDEDVYLLDGETYTITADDVGKVIFLEVYCDDRDGFLYSEEITVLEDAITAFSVKESWVYGETENGFIVTSNSGADSVFTYSDKKDGIYTDTVPTDVGTYWVKASIVADDGTVRAEATISFEITKETQTISIDSIGEKTYGDDDFDLVVNGVKENAKLSYEVIDGGNVVEVDSDGKVTILSSGFAIIKVTAAETTNYNSDIAEIGITIQEKKIVVTPDAGQWKYYGEADQELTYSYTGNLNDVTFTGALSRVAGASIGFYAIKEGNLDENDDNHCLGFDYTVTYEIREYTTDAKVTELDDWLSQDTVTLVAPEGYTISLTNGVEDEFIDSITVNTIEDDNAEITYYLRSATGAISTAKTFTYSNDQTDPTGVITIGENKFRSFLNTITFNMFFKDTTSVSIEGADELSGVASVEYQKVESEIYFDATNEQNWTTGTGFNVTANNQFIIYARITDEAGNVIVINSNGVTVFTDSAQETESFDFVKNSDSEDQIITVTLNGNTVESISLNGKTVSAKNYTVDGNEITFAAEYLETLTRGENVFTISYDPLGTDDSKTTKDSDEIGTTTVTANVYEVITDKTDTDQETTYNSELQSPSIPIAETVGEKLVIRYSDDEGETYILTEIPSFEDAGTYTVYYELSVEDHVTSYGEITFTIEKVQLTWNSGTVEGKVYDGTTDATVDVAPTLNGVIGDDTAPEIIVGTATFADKNVGTHAVTATGYGMVDDTNYTAPATQPTFEDATIQQATITVVPTLGLSSYYGADLAELTYEYSGVVAGDVVTFSGSLALDITPSDTAADVDTTFVITQGTLSLVDADNYVMNFETGVEYDIVQKDIKASIKNDKDWQSTGTITLVAPEGYLISTSSDIYATPDWAAEITLDAEETANGVFTYYLREIEEGSISVAKEYTYKNDITDPTALISVAGGTWTTLLETITFGWFSTDMEAITIKADDELSGVNSVKYYVGDETTDVDSIKWESYYDFLGIKPTLILDDTYVIYAKVTDNAGNETIVSSDGIAIYSNSTSKTEEVTYIRTTTDDVVIDVNFNGNTLEKVTIDGKVLDAKYYTIGNKSITIDGDYLDTLSAKDYAIVISFNPQGVDYNKTSVGEAPDTVDVTLHVIKATPVYEDYTMMVDSTVYTGIMSGTFFKTDLVYAPSYTITYTNSNGDVVKYPVDADTYTVSITTKENAYYYAAELGTWEYTITEASTSIYITDIEDTVYESDVTITAYVAGKALTVPEGYVDFYNHGEYIGTADTVDGIAILIVAEYDMIQPDAGTYSITAVFTSTDTNFSGSETKEAVVFDVLKAEQNITIEEVIDITYGDDAFDLVVNNVKGDAELTYIVEGDAVTVDENGTVTVVGSGVVTIIVTALETDNYNSGTAYVTFEVAKKAVSVVIDDQEIVRGMDILELTGTVEGDLESDVVTPTYSVTADNMVAGEYEITMANAEDYAHYDIAITTGTLTITTGYTVTFDGEAMTDVAYGTVLEESIPTKDGYTFVAWVTEDGEVYNFETPVTGGLDLTSTWDEIAVEDTIEEVVDTADHAEFMLWYVVLFTSFLGMVVLEIRRKRL